MLAPALSGCIEPVDTTEIESVQAAVTSENGLWGCNGLWGGNGLQSSNGLWGGNGAQANSLQTANGLQVSNSLQSTTGLSSVSGLMTTAEGRTTVEYLVRCAMPANTTLVKQDQYGTNYTFKGSLGFGPGWQKGACDTQCQEYVSACMMAHVNTAGVHIPLWIVAQSPGIGWALNPSYPNQEGSFFGNVFTAGAHGTDATTFPAFYCNGVSYAVDTVPGRIGAGTTGAPYSDPYISGIYASGTTGYCSDYCTPSDYPYTSSGYKACAGWNNVVTTYRQAATGGNIVGTSSVGLTAALAKYDEKKDGYCANINLTNKGASTLKSWVVTFDVGAPREYKPWGAVETVSGTVHTARTPAATPALAPGGTYSFGYCAKFPPPPPGSPPGTASVIPAPAISSVTGS